MNQRAQARVKSLLPNGIPRWVRAYREITVVSDEPVYTVVYTGRYKKMNRHDQFRRRMCLDPARQAHMMLVRSREIQAPDTSRHGFAPTFGRKSRFGVRIRFENLPAPFQEIVAADYRNIWSLPPVAMLRPTSPLSIMTVDDVLNALGPERGQRKRIMLPGGEPIHSLTLEDGVFVINRTDGARPRVSELLGVALSSTDTGSTRSSDVLLTGNGG